jgi:hypothetical protein
VHINSIDVDSDGQPARLLAQHAHRLQDRPPLRRDHLAPRRQEQRLRDGAGATFAWQHDARRQADGTLTIFDNEGSPERRPAVAGDRARRRRAGRTASLQRQYRHPLALQASSWAASRCCPTATSSSAGARSRSSRSSHASASCCSTPASAPATSATARFAFPWSATGEAQPTIAAQRNAEGATDLWVSWNGDTEVERWQVLAGGRSGALKPLATRRATPLRPIDRRQIDARGACRPPRRSRFAARGLDGRGRVLATSPTLAHDTRRAAQAPPGLRAAAQREGPGGGVGGRAGEHARRYRERPGRREGLRAEARVRHRVVDRRGGRRDRFQPAPEPVASLTSKASVAVSVRLAPFSVVVGKVSVDAGVPLTNDSAPAFSITEAVVLACALPAHAPAAAITSAISPRRRCIVALSARVRAAASPRAGNRTSVQRPPPGARAAGC